MASRAVEEGRIKRLNTREAKSGDYVLYWMQQSQRAEFNPALEYAIQRANEAKLLLLVGLGLMDLHESRWGWLLWVEGPGSFLPPLQRLLCAKGNHSFPPGCLLQNRFGLGRPIAKQMCGGHDSYVHALMLE